MRRGVCVLAVLVVTGLVTTASAIAYPVYEGAQTFPTIHGPADLEEYTWEVQLYEGQTLEQVDDRQAVVRYESGHLAFTIVAEASHDATGAEVPTTIAVTQPNLFTLTVHHRAGNPAAGGTPFDYPVNPGEGWESGFAAVTVDMGTPTEQVAPSTVPLVPPCIVPDLTDRTLKATRHQLRRAHCGIGEIRGDRRHGARVVKQFRKPGKSLPAGTEVGVKLLAP